MDSQIAIVFIGAPGVGKGTQAELLAKSRSWIHLSSGQILREQAPDRIKHQMDRGELVVEPAVDKILEKALLDAPKDKVWVLDGFIRLKQDEVWLERCLPQLGRSLAAVIFIDVPEAESKKRLSLRGRADDTAQALAERWAEYSDQTVPVIESYRSRGLLRVVNGVGTVDEIANRIDKVLS